MADQENKESTTVVLRRAESQDNKVSANVPLDGVDVDRDTHYIFEFYKVVRGGNVEKLGKEDIKVHNSRNRISIPKKIITEYDLKPGQKIRIDKLGKAHKTIDSKIVNEKQKGNNEKFTKVDIAKVASDSHNSDGIASDLNSVKLWDMMGNGEYEVKYVNKSKRTEESGVISRNKSHGSITFKKSIRDELNAEIGDKIALYMKVDENYDPIDQSGDGNYEIDEIMEYVKETNKLVNELYAAYKKSNGSNS